MKYSKTIILKNGVECCLRNGIESDGQAVWDCFNLTHGQTDYLLSYPDENSFDVMQEGQFLKKKSESSNEIEIVAVVGNVVVGTAGIEAIGERNTFIVSGSQTKYFQNLGDTFQLYEKTFAAKQPGSFFIGGTVYKILNFFGITYSEDYNQMSG